MFTRSRGRGEAGEGLAPGLRAAAAHPPAWQGAGGRRLPWLLLRPLQEPGGGGLLPFPRLVLKTAPGGVATQVFTL